MVMIPLFYAMSTAAAEEASWGGEREVSELCGREASWKVARASVFLMPARRGAKASLRCARYRLAADAAVCAEKKR